MAIFNAEATGHLTGEYPLVLGEERGLYDNINVNHPRLFKLYEDLKAIDWTHNEIPLDQTKMDLLSVDPLTRDVMLLNLAYQWEMDSAVSNSLATLLLPFITNHEYAHVISKIAENENLHALTYSNIVRQCIPDTQEVFDMVYKQQQVLTRSNSTIEALNKLEEVGAKYKLGLMTKEECRPYIFRGIIAVFIIERVSFMNSFACTFALGSQDLFVGAAKYVQKICQDEMIHFEVGRYAAKDILGDKSFKECLKSEMPTVLKMLEDTRNAERDWNTFIFSEGRSVVGLNQQKLDQWCDWNLQNVYDSLGLSTPFTRVLKDPLPWFASDWVDLNSQQNANMEAPTTNYPLNTIIDDGSEMEVDDEFDL